MHAVLKLNFTIFSLSDIHSNTKITLPQSLLDKFDTNISSPIAIITYV